MVPTRDAAGMDIFVELASRVFQAFSELQWNLHAARISRHALRERNAAGPAIGFPGY